MTKHQRPIPLGCLLTVAALLAAAAGCHRKAVVPARRIAQKPGVTDAQLASYKANEAGAIMILMYHDFDAKKPNADLNRQPNTFRQDLEALYKRGYRPVTVSELIDNKMDVPAGKTPIALTFDDSKPTQFRIVTGKDGQPHIDPNCMVGIMETFHKQHADWPTKGTLFVLPKEGRNPDPFSQPESVADKFTYLLQHGYEIANHTSTHKSMHGMNATQVQWELATAHRDIKQIAPQATLDVFALPYGALPRNPEARHALVSGAANGVSYKHKAVLLAAWRPVLSPITKNDKKLSQGGTYCIFNRFRLERIKPNPKQANLPGTFEYWLKYFDKNPGQRYISGGDLKIAAIPASMKPMVDEARVRAQGKTLRVYGLSTSKGGGGSSLSVE